MLSKIGTNRISKPLSFWSRTTRHQQEPSGERSNRLVLRVKIFALEEKTILKELFLYGKFKSKMITSLIRNKHDNQQRRKWWWCLGQGGRLQLRCHSWKKKKKQGTLIINNSNISYFFDLLFTHLFLF